MVIRALLQNASIDFTPIKNCMKSLCSRIEGYPAGICNFTVFKLMTFIAIVANTDPKITNCFYMCVTKKFFDDKWESLLTS